MVSTTSSSFIAFVAFLITISNALNYKSIIDDTSLTDLGGMTMSMAISDQDDLVTITLSGPSFVYYSIGVGSCSMSGAWSLVVPGLTASDGSTPFEQLLGKDEAGSSLDSSFEVVDDTIDGLLRTVTFTRALSSDLTDDYYSFTTDDEDILVMWAYGSEADFSNHGEYQRDCTTLSFTKSLQTEQAQTLNAHTFHSFSMFGKWSQSTGSLIFVVVLLGMVMVYAAYLKYCKRARNKMSEEVEEMQALISVAPTTGQYNSV